MDRQKEQADALLSRELQFDDDFTPFPKTKTKARHTYKFILVESIAILSIILNIIAAVDYFAPKNVSFRDVPTDYSGLPHDQPVVYDWESPFGPGNQNSTLQDEVWEAMTIGQGIISLPKDWAKAKGLHPSATFPWDHSRAVYLVAGYHKLHCIKKIRRWIVATERGSQRTDHYEHVLHCLDGIRQAILCEGDDTPLYLSEVGDKISGRDEPRQCRDWSKLDRWAKENTACYGYDNEAADDSGGIKHYKYCPRDSPYAPVMREYFGLPDDYYEEPVEEVPSY
ncbi:hypothetical protein BGW36DRAFT_354212 [Talaromyces proteolyticus]|uniref:Uncharacterized protein n=1 Tax=Talaromyces proteolyticus TaxID=1131652 RepID=A0AAD4L4M3_9EURO|nr:uncharacterized protein BGW36DRAFT_354212 [Talaromyces proteolyticus]KAH8705818.1 hypothetical protein BGW36DRAFT_354212 [Talaromyces proteolyticus]